MDEHHRAPYRGSHHQNGVDDRERHSRSRSRNSRKDGVYFGKDNGFTGIDFRSQSRARFNNRSGPPSRPTQQRFNNHLSVGNFNHPPLYDSSLYSQNSENRPLNIRRQSSHSDLPLGSVAIPAAASGSLPNHQQQLGGMYPTRQNSDQPYGNNTSLDSAGSYERLGSQPRPFSPSPNVYCGNSFQKSYIATVEPLVAPTPLNRMNSFENPPSFFNNNVNYGQQQHKQPRLSHSMSFGSTRWPQLTTNHYQPYGQHCQQLRPSDEQVLNHRNEGVQPFGDTAGNNSAPSSFTSHYIPSLNNQPSAFNSSNGMLSTGCGSAAAVANDFQKEPLQEQAAANKKPEISKEWLHELNMMCEESPPDEVVDLEYDSDEKEEGEIVSSDDDVLIIDDVQSSMYNGADDDADSTLRQDSNRSASAVSVPAEVDGSRGSQEQLPPVSQWSLSRPSTAPPAHESSSFSQQQKRRPLIETPPVHSATDLFASVPPPTPTPISPGSTRMPIFATVTPLVPSGARHSQFGYMSQPCLFGANRNLPLSQTQAFNQPRHNTNRTESDSFSVTDQSTDHETSDLDMRDKNIRQGAQAYVIPNRRQSSECSSASGSAANNPKSPATAAADKATSDADDAMKRARDRNGTESEGVKKRGSHVPDNARRHVPVARLVDVEGGDMETNADADSTNSTIEVTSTTSEATAATGTSQANGFRTGQNATPKSGRHTITATVTKLGSCEISSSGSTRTSGNVGRFGSKGCCDDVADDGESEQRAVAGGGMASTLAVVEKISTPHSHRATVQTLQYPPEYGTPPNGGADSNNWRAVAKNQNGMNGGRRSEQTMVSSGGGQRRSTNFGSSNYAAGATSDELTSMLTGSTVSFIDSHCHLDFIYNKLRAPDGTFATWRSKYPDAFPANFHGCIPNFIDPSLFMEGDPKKFDRVWMLDQIADPMVLGASYGIHPHYSDQCTPKVMEEIRDMCRFRKETRPVAIGECGLDFYKCTHNQQVQEHSFVAQMKLAVEVSLPLIIHCRSGRDQDAEGPCLDLLKKHMSRFHHIHRHCFTGSWEVAQRWMDAFPNIYFGFTNGVAQFNKEQMDAFRNIPLDRILLETDAPYFRPRLFDSSRQAGPTSVALPGMAIAVGHLLARERNIPVDDVLRQSFRNTQRMYCLEH